MLFTMNCIITLVKKLSNLCGYVEFALRLVKSFKK